jgi:hypothetical protein
MMNPKIVDAINSKNHIKFHIIIVGTPYQQTFQKNEGASESEVVEIGVFKDAHEAYLVGSHMMVNFLKNTPELLANQAGLVSPKSNHDLNCTLIIRIFKSKPTSTNYFACFRHYSAKFDQVWSLALKDAEIMARTFMMIKNVLNRDDFWVTLGCTTCPATRLLEYMKTNVYRTDDGLEQLEDCPHHYTIEDMLLRKALGLIAAKSHPVLSKHMSNFNGGADSVPVASNIEQLNPKLKSYYHISIPGISRFELNLIKGFIPLKVNEWKGRNYPNIEMIRPNIIKVVAVKNHWICMYIVLVEQREPIKRELLF